jgi:A/G-specific adenine glycosylase
MLKTAHIIDTEYNWVFPDSYDNLINLPWVGPYTAQAILSFGHNKNILAFDTNIEKIFSRYYFGNKFQKLSKIQKQDIQNMFEKTWISWRNINAAMMDFSSIIDINQINLIDFENYPLKDSRFFETKWSLEIKPIVIKKPVVSKKNAKIIVILHKNHELYLSAHPDNFEGFKFDTFSWDHRHYIQDIFSRQYNLDLSVRPPYKKIASSKWDYFFYHAQIQSGQHGFWEFSKSEKLEWEDNF